MALQGWSQVGGAWMLRFENLDVWKRGTALCVEMYRYFSGVKDFGFRDQITRSALSVPSNIAEGFERLFD